MKMKMKMKMKDPHQHEASEVGSRNKGEQPQARQLMRVKASLLVTLPQRMKKNPKKSKEM